MTTHDDLDRGLREWFHDRSRGPAPGHLLDAVARDTAARRPRRAWANVFHPDTLAWPGVLSPTRGRLVLVLAAGLLLLAAVAGTLIVGSQRPQLSVEPGPTPVVLRADGPIVYSDMAGDIHSLDPLTGETALLVGGPTQDLAPWMAPDGQHFIFVRVDDDLLYIANADGTDVKPFAGAKDLNVWDWSPRSDRIAGVPDGGGDLSIIDVVTASARVVSLERPVTNAYWVGDDRILLADQSGNPSPTVLWTINADGTGQTAFDTPGICEPCGVTTLPGSGLVAWTGGGRAHILDTATGLSAVIPASDALGTTNTTPRFSPDGKWLTVLQSGSSPGAQLTLIPAAGTEGILTLGPRTARTDSPIGSVFSPDGTRLLVTFEDGSAWFFDLTNGTGRKTDWQGIAAATW